MPADDVRDLQGCSDCNPCLRHPVVFALGERRCHCGLKYTLKINFKGINYFTKGTQHWESLQLLSIIYYSLFVFALLILENEYLQELTIQLDADISSCLVPGEGLPWGVCGLWFLESLSIYHPLCFWWILVKKEAKRFRTNINKPS